MVMLDVLCIFILFSPIMCLNTSTVFPSPRTRHNRILAMVLSYNLDHIESLLQLYHNYVSIYEAGWRPLLVFQTTVKLTPTLNSMISSKLFSLSKNTTVPFKFDTYDNNTGTELGTFHRSYIAKHYHRFDFFIYHEDDIMVTNKHIMMYTQETKRLETLMNSTEFQSHLIGFQRYVHNPPTFNQHANHTPVGIQDILKYDAFEEYPTFVPICIQDLPYIRVDGNTHQALWMLTKNQLLFLQDKCKFFNYSMGNMWLTREYMSSLQLFYFNGNSIGHDHCKMNKLIPLHSFLDSLIQHYYATQHIIKYKYVYEAYQNIIYGKHLNKEYPSCWINAIQHYRSEHKWGPVNRTTTTTTT